MREFKVIGELYGDQALDLFRHIYALAPRYFQNPKKMHSYYYELCETNGFEFRKLNNERDEIKIVISGNNTISLNNEEINTSVKHLDSIPNLYWLLKFQVLSNKKNMKNLPAKVEILEKELFGWDTRCNAFQFNTSDFSEYMQQENIRPYVEQIFDGWITRSINGMIYSLPPEVFNKNKEEFTNKLKETFHSLYSNSFETPPHKFHSVSISDDNFSFYYKTNECWYVSIKKEGTIKNGRKLTLCEKVMGIRYE